jgi:AcrR family transcriptional regulator
MPAMPPIGGSDAPTGLPGALPPSALTLEERVLDAAQACCERWGRAKVTVDDIAAEAGCSRATIYRLFPGGRDNLFEALRAREHAEFFTRLDGHLAGATSLEDLVVRGLVAATRALRDDEHLRLVLAADPGETVNDLTVEGLPKIAASAAAYLGPWFAPHVGDRSDELAEWLSRIVVSYFLAPSPFHDLADEASATAFTRRFVLPAFDPSTHPVAAPAAPSR